MKCPECEKSGERSFFYEDECCISTAMCSHSYFDEDGREHRHNPNTRSLGAHCSKGHEFRIKLRSLCRVPDCKWNNGRLAREMTLTQPTGK